jgi:ferrous iron transport protein B
MFHGMISTKRENDFERGDIRATDAPFKYGFKSDKLNKFLSLPSVNVIATYVGSLLPNFTNKLNQNMWIEDMINSDTLTTGLLCTVDVDMIESVNVDDASGFVDEAIDIIGHNFNEIIDDVNSINFLSYSFSQERIDELIGIDSDNSFIDTLSNHDELVSVKYEEQQRILHELSVNAEEALIDAKYGFIQGALKETHRCSQTKKQAQTLSERIDRVVTNRWLSYPIFLTILFLVFEATFTLGEYPMKWLSWIVDNFAAFIMMSMPEGMMRDMIVDGVIGGVGSVLIFLPNILLLYLFISLLEDTGYMARTAFITDKLMHCIGLHGKSLIPMVMGFGCNVPSVMATRMIENPKSRLITMLIIPFMSCSARLPIYILLIGAFFPNAGSIVMFFLYLLGIVIALISAKIFSKYFRVGEDLPFVMELPPYRIPVVKSIIRHTWEKGRQYLHKMAGLILAFSIVIWALGYFKFSTKTSGEPQTKVEYSYLEYLGHVIQPIFAPMDFDWKMSVGILSGVGAKELVVSTLGVLYSVDTDVDSTDTTTHLQSAISNNISQASALAYMVFILLYLPCIATIIAIKSESGSWKWALFSIVYSTTLAYIISWLSYCLLKTII